MVYAPCRIARPGGNVRRSGENRTYRGHRKSFQLVRNDSSSNVLSAGLDNGRTTRKNVCQGLAPSTRAASSSSTGSPRKNWRRKKTPNAPAAFGTMTASNVSSQPNEFVMTKFGIRKMIGGMNSVDTITANM